MQSTEAGDSGTDAIKNVICVSDLHIGCRLGLCPPDGFPLDDGGRYFPSEEQVTVWRWWEEFWDVWVPSVTHGEVYDIVINGDAIDGSHHNSTTQISQNPSDQEAFAFRVLDMIRGRCRRLYMVRGTEAHVGKSACDEERLARKLEAHPNKHGQHARWDLWQHVGDGLVHYLHHVGTTSSTAHEASAVNAELRAEFDEAARTGKPIPDCIIRSHRHRHIEIRVPTYRGFAIASVTPGWQLKTPFSWKIAGARLTTPQFGGLLIRYGDELYTRPWTRYIDRTDTEV